MATMKDIAARAGVSLGTVSNVLAGTRVVTPELRRRVEEAVRELGYRPNLAARSLKTKQTGVIGMVVSDIANPFFPTMVRGAEEALHQRGYILTTFNTDDCPDRERQVFDILQSRAVDGILVVVALMRASHSHVRRCLESGTPVVCLDRRPSDLQADSVTVDNAAAVRSAIEHLIELGHTRIGYVGGDPRMYIAPERLFGYRQAMRRAGLRPQSVTGDFRVESGYKLGGRLLDGADRPTAIFGANLPMTLGILRAVRERNLDVPGDVSIATVDHLPLIDCFHPRLTCVIQPTWRIGFEGAELLLDRIDGKVAGDPRHRILETSLRIAESAGEPGKTPG